MRMLWTEKSRSPCSADWYSNVFFSIPMQLTYHNISSVDVAPLDKLVIKFKTGVTNDQKREVGAAFSNSLPQALVTNARPLSDDPDASDGDVQKT